MSPRGSIMAKIGLIAFAIALLLTGASYAADKITLTCSGTIKTTDFIHGESGGSPVSTSIVVDLDQGTVATANDVYSITKVTENHIDFHGKSTTGGEAYGRIDRVSGTTGWSIRDSAGTKSLWTLFDLNCKPAKPLF